MIALRKVAFIGCNTMGAPMAERLLDAGADLRIFDPSSAATASLVARGAKPGGAST